MSAGISMPQSYVRGRNEDLGVRARAIIETAVIQAAIWHPRTWRPLVTMMFSLANFEDPISCATWPEGLRYGDDGSLRVYIQRESPGADRESNWLPAEDGPFDVTLRIYWPDPAALDPLYVPPPIRKAN